MLAVYYLANPNPDSRKVKKRHMSPRASSVHVSLMASYILATYYLANPNPDSWKVKKRHVSPRASSLRVSPDELHVCVSPGLVH